MADDKQFQELIEAQKKTNQLLLLDHDTKMEHDRVLANEENAAREAAQKENTKEEEKTRGLLSKIIKGILGTGGGKKKEEEQKEGFWKKKQTALLKSMSGGIKNMAKSMKDSMKSKAKGLLAMVKGTLFAGLLVAIIAFLNSETWQDMKKYIAEELVPKMVNFYNNTLKPFATGILNFIKDPSWGTFKDIFDVESKGGLVAALAGVTALLAPGLLLAPLKLGIKGMSAAFSLLGTSLGGKTPAAAGSAMGALPGIAKKGGIAKLFLKGARFLGPAGLIATAGFTLWQGAKAGMAEYEKTGELSSAIKAGASTALSTLTFGLVKPETFSGAFDYVGERFTTLTAGTKEMAVNAWNNVKDAIPNAQEIKTNFLELKDQAVAMTTKVGGYAKDAYTAIKDKIPTADTVKETFTSIKDNLINAIPTKEAIVAAIPTEEDLKVAFTNLKTNLEPLKNIKLPDEFSVSAITEALITNTDAINDAFTNITGINVKQKFTELKNSFENITGMTIPSFSDIAANVTSKIREIGSAITGFASGTLDSVREGFTGVKEKLLSVFDRSEAVYNPQLGFGGFGGSKRPTYSAPAPYSGSNPDVDFYAGARGGPFRAGVPMLVGEEGPEFILPNRGGRVVNAQRTDAMRDSMIQRRLDGMGGMGGQAIIAPTNVANQSSTNITHTTTSIVNPDLVVSTVNKAA